MWSDSILLGEDVNLVLTLCVLSSGRLVAAWWYTGTETLLLSVGLTCSVQCSKAGVILCPPSICKLSGCFPVSCECFRNRRLFPEKSVTYPVGWMRTSVWSQLCSDCFHTCKKSCLPPCRTPQGSCAGHVLPQGASEAWGVCRDRAACGRQRLRTRREESLSKQQYSEALREGQGRSLLQCRLNDEGGGKNPSVLDLLCALEFFHLLK